MGAGAVASACVVCPVPVPAIGLGLLPEHHVDPIAPQKLIVAFPGTSRPAQICHRSVVASAQREELIPAPAPQTHFLIDVEAGLGLQKGGSVLCLSRAWGPTAFVSQASGPRGDRCDLLAREPCPVAWHHVELASPRGGDRRPGPQPPWTLWGRGMGRVWQGPATVSEVSRLSTVPRRNVLPRPQTGSSRSCLWATRLWARRPS